MTRTITHKHLKRQFEAFEETGNLNDLFAELEFSTLLLPVDIENGSFPILKANDKIFAPVFTDIHEYEKCDINGDFTLMPNGFDFYLDLLDERIDGIIVDAEGERFPLTREIRSLIMSNTPSKCNPRIFTMDEIRQKRESANNSKLEEFLKDESNRWDYDRLMKLLLESDIYKVVLSREDLSDKAQDGVISLDHMLPAALTTSFAESHALIYSSEGEVRKKDNPMNPYLQFADIPELIRSALLNDLDGIILNENSQSIRIPREFLMDFYRNHAPACNGCYDGYAFTLNF